MNLQLAANKARAYWFLYCASPTSASSSPPTAYGKNHSTETARSVVDQPDGSRSLQRIVLDRRLTFDKHVKCRLWCDRVTRRTLHLISTADPAETLACVVAYRLRHRPLTVHCNVVLHSAPVSSIQKSEDGAFSEHCRQDCSVSPRRSESTPLPSTR